MQDYLEKDIDGITFQFSHFPPSKAFKLQRRLIKKIGAPLARGLGNVDGELSLDSDIDINALLPAIGDLLVGLDDAEADSLILELLSNIRAKSGDGWLKWDQVENILLRGRTMIYWKVIVEQVRFQFADFFNTLDGVDLKSLVGAPRVGQNAPKASIGSSGGSFSLKSQRSKK